MVEGWYGQPSNRPIARTREYVQILRNVLSRKNHIRNEGEFWPLPYSGNGSLGLGKSLKIMTHPLRSDLPIFIGAEGPRNVAQACEIADGWLPLYYSPSRPEVYAEQIAHRKEGFEISVNVPFAVTDDVEAGLLPVRTTLSFYIGGMGAKGQNYHTQLMKRMGFEKEAVLIQNLFLEGHRDKAIAAVPTEFADEISLVGPPKRIRERLAIWEESPVTMINVAAHSLEELRIAAELVLG